MKTVKIVFSEQYYFPEGWGGAQIPRDLTIHLAKSGYRVTVICGMDQYSSAGSHAIEDPRVYGITLSRVPKIVPGPARRLRIVRQAWFYAAGFLRLLLVSRPSLYVTQTNPPLIVVIVFLVAKLRRKPFVIICQDLYPEVVFAHGVLRRNSAMGRLLRAIFGKAYRGADKVVSLGPVMSQRLKEKGVPSYQITTISNWSTGDSERVCGPENRLRKEWKLRDTFVLLYSGNLGLSHDVTTPIRALARARALSVPVKLVFIGGGSRLSEARAASKEFGVESLVDFHGWVPLDDLPQSQGLADIALVTLQPEFSGLVVPSKALGYLARSIPIIYIGPVSDVHDIVLDSRAGYCFENGDDQGVADAVNRLFLDSELRETCGRNGREYYAARLDQRHGLAGYSRLVEEMTSH